MRNTNWCVTATFNHLPDNDSGVTVIIKCYRHPWRSDRPVKLHKWNAFAFQHRDNFEIVFLVRLSRRRSNRHIGDPIDTALSELSNVLSCLGEVTVVVPHEEIAFVRLHSILNSTQRNGPERMT